MLNWPELQTSDKLDNGFQDGLMYRINGSGGDISISCQFLASAAASSLNSATVYQHTLAAVIIVFTSMSALNAL